MSRETLEERINKYIIINPEGCWLWFGAANKSYGIIYNNGKSCSVKKLLYFMKHPDYIDEGYLHQNCKDKSCVNPNHLINRKEYFDSFINKDGECWNWTGEIKGGYGYFSINHINLPVHRLMYEKYKGKITKGKCVCHSCDNTKCVNPDHLWLGSHSDNMKDMIQKERGNKSKGEAHYNSKINEQQVLEIKKQLSHGLSMRQIERNLKISYRIIQHIKHGTTWAHI